MTDPRVDVDARFLLANERTLLAWVRTSLTLLAAGVGALHFLDGVWRFAPALGLLMLAAVASRVGMTRHARADRAIREGQLPPTGRGPALIAGAVGVVAVAVTVLAAAASLQE